jgi:hypothetical protein
MHMQAFLTERDIFDALQSIEELSEFCRPVQFLSQIFAELDYTPFHQSNHQELA